MPRLVIGLGSGRCGTMSLAGLLAVQKDTASTHEDFPTIPWDATEFLVKHRVSRIMLRGAPVVSDSAFYYLPHVRVIAAAWPETKFVCLRRERESCIDSLLRKIENGVINPYQSGPNAGEFGDALPTYDGVSLREAVSKYYDDYYEASRSLSDDLPGTFRVFDMADLNSESGVESILTFCGYSEQVIKTNIKLNELK